MPHHPSYSRKLYLFSPLALLLWLVCVVLPASAAEEIDRREPRSLAFGMFAWPSLPLRPEAQIRVDLLLNCNVFEPLVREGVTGLEPALAESWSTWDDGWIFQLRSGVLAHDGRSVDANLVGEYLKSVSLMSVDTRSHFLHSVDRIEALSENLLLLKQSHLSTDLPSEIADVGIGFATDSGEFVGSGPYRYEYDGSGRARALIWFDRHWGDEPRVRRVDFTVRNDPEKLTGLLTSGSLHLIAGVPEASLGELESQPGIKVVSAHGGTMLIWGLNPNSSLLGSKLARAGIDLAVDRETLNAVAFDGRAEAATQIPGVNIFGHDPRVSMTRRAVERARWLLSESFDTEEPSLDVLLLAELEEAATMLAEQLSEVGVQLNLEVVDQSEFYRRVSEGDADSILAKGSHPPTLNRPYFDALFHTPDAATGRGRFNFFSWSNSEVDDLLDLASAEQDLARQLELWWAIGARTRDEAIVLPLLWFDDFYAGRDWLRFEAPMNGCVEFGRVEIEE